MPRFRRQRMLMGKSHEKHSGTKIHIIGPATVARPFHIIRDTEVGARDPAGGNDTVQLGRSYDEECNIGDSCKYVNIHLETGPRNDTNEQNIGWIEWAFVIKKSSDADPTNTNLGTQTLGDVCTKYFRNECIYTGAVAHGFQQTNVAEITLKIPKNKVNLRTGDVWLLYFHARTISATETSTNSMQVISSYNYINYH